MAFVAAGAAVLLAWPAVGAFANIRDMTVSQDDVPTVAPGDTTTVTLTVRNPANGDTPTYNRMYIFKAEDTTFENLTVSVTDSQSNAVSFNNCFDFDFQAWACDVNGGTPIFRQGETYTVSIGGIRLNDGVALGTTVQAGRWNTRFDAADNGQSFFPAPPDVGAGPFPYSVTAGTAPPPPTTTTTAPPPPTTTPPTGPVCRFVYVNLLGWIRICI